MRERPLRYLALLSLLSCSRAELLHGLEERQANQVLVALEEGGLRASVRRDEGSEAGYLVELAAGDAARARQILAERELPRREPGGLAGAYAKESVVPTPAEERARFLLALSGELARTVESLDGVLEARVHLALPLEDPLRGLSAGTPRGAVLVKVRPGARARLDPLATGIQSLVAGSVVGLEPAQVAVILAEAAPAPQHPFAPPRRPLRLTLSAAAASAGLLLLLAASGAKLPTPRRRPDPTP